MNVDFLTGVGILILGGIAMVVFARFLAKRERLRRQHLANHAPSNGFPPAQR